MRTYFKGLVARYFDYFLLPGCTVLTVDDSGQVVWTGSSPPDYVVIDGSLHHVGDIQSLLGKVHGVCGPGTRILIAYYSSLWRPALRLADWMGIRKERKKEQNWVSPSDLENLLELCDFELVSSSRRILIPFRIPILSDTINRWIAPFPGLSWLSLLNLAVVKPRIKSNQEEISVSVVVAARNESGNLEALFRRLPIMGKRMELVIVEGGSTDSTWSELQRFSAMDHPYPVLIAKQDGKGKGDAIRKGFSLASNEILMVLDADLTVPPEVLPRFYEALKFGRGEFINGSRLVYPMDQAAMRFFNMVGNKFFALTFSFLLGRNFKDTLCGTKALSRDHYLKIANHRSYFGDFDPFGDFDLLFGASRLGLKIIELPIHYRERVYGETNISRWRHGFILLRMVLFAARRIRFI